MMPVLGFEPKWEGDAQVDKAGRGRAWEQEGSAASGARNRARHEQATQGHFGYLCLRF